VADTRIWRADTGAEVRIGDLAASGQRDVPVWSLDDRLKLVPARLTHAFPTGVKEVFRVRLRSGREIQATANHPFLTYDGWRPIGDLAVGSRVAIPRHVPASLAERELPEAGLMTLPGRLADPGAVVPATAFALPKRQLAAFLRHLWSAGGSAWWDALGGRARIAYASASREVVEDVARLLLRFDIMTRVELVASVRPVLPGGPGLPGYQVLICGADDQLRFLDRIGIGGASADCAAQARQMLLASGGDSRLDTVPREVWGKISAVLAERHMPEREFAAAIGSQLSGQVLRSYSPSRARVGQIADLLGDSDLELLATNDVFWDEVASVESIGEQEVYDATVAGTHNFIANGVHVHNSIEQDADVVILLHREDAYERESPRAGEADFIVAKHRNGPTTTVTVAFQGHYSRFVDMARM
jgi:replicative DNA helicase